MNIHPPPPPPINAVVTALVAISEYIIREESIYICLFRGKFTQQILYFGTDFYLFANVSSSSLRLFTIDPFVFFQQPIDNILIILVLSLSLCALASRYSCFK